MGEKEHKDCGKCIFCLSKCPECGSTDIHVKYRVEFVYNNDMEDNLHIESDLIYSQIYCHDCGEEIEGSDKRLEKLNIILESLASSTMEVNIENRKIKEAVVVAERDNWLREEQAAKECDLDQVVDKIKNTSKENLLIIQTFLAKLEQNAEHSLADLLL